MSVLVSIGTAAGSMAAVIAIVALIAKTRPSRYLGRVLFVKPATDVLDARLDAQLVIHMTPIVATLAENAAKLEPIAQSAAEARSAATAARVAVDAAHLAVVESHDSVQAVDERLARIEAETKVNGGSTIKDQLNKNAADMEYVRNSLHALRGSSEMVANLLAAHIRDSSMHDPAPGGRRTDDHQSKEN